MRHQRRTDRGFAVVLLALGMVVLLGATTVAVDLGSRYSQAAKIQRSADAAALAAVTMLPSGMSAAIAEARQVAARNGFVHGQDGVIVEVTQPTVGGLPSTDSLRVRIEDAALPVYFGSMFGGTDHVARVATAEYVSAVALGSPRNHLGTGDLMGNSGAGGDMAQVVDRTRSQTAALRENFWLAVNGPCSSKENGDRYTARSAGNYSNHSNPRSLSGGVSFRCEGSHGDGHATQDNDEQRWYGYVYAVTVPPGYVAGEIDIEIYDPAVCNGSRSGDSSNGAMSTTYTVRTGSLDPLAGTVLDRHGWPTGATHTESFDPRTWGCDSWHTLTSVRPPVEGATYYVQVSVGEDSYNGPRTNGFALRADVDSKRRNGRFWACSSDESETSLYASDCPQVYAVGDMGVYASLTGTQAEFFVSEIGPEHNGKTLEITLFDPGEGAEALRIKDPSGDYVTFDWDVDCSGGVAPPTGGCSGSSVDRLDLIGNTYRDVNSGYRCSGGRDVDLDGNGSADDCAWNPQPGPHRLSRWKYNERSLTLSIDLPEDIASEYGGATWWKVEYTTNTAPTDRTTWSVRVQGDPVRLIPNTPV